MAKNPYVAQLRRTLRGTPLAPYAQLIARVEAKNKLPKGLLAGIAKAESSFGTAGRSGHQTNPFGWMSAGGPAEGLMPFPNLGAAIRHVGSTLGQRGWRDPAKFGSTYVGEPTWQQNWLPNVRSVMSQMGGGVPTAPPRSGRTPSPVRPDANRKKEVLGLLFQLFAARQSGVSTSALIPLVLSMTGDRTPLGPRGSQPERNTRIPVDNTERSVVNVAREFLLSDRKETYSMGSPYGRSIYPQNTRSVKSFDCSSFIQYVYWKATGKKLVKSGSVDTSTLWRVGQAVNANPQSLAVGDAIFFGGRNGVPVAGGSSHVGMYIGNGKFIHSSSSGQVKVSDLASYGRKPIGARRYL